MDEMQQLNRIVGNNIKYYRELYNAGKRRDDRITQEKLAELIDVSTSTIGNLESECSSLGISIYNLWKISKVLNVSIEKFFEQR